MAAYEILLLNTAIPQIQAAQSGDTYVVPRDIAFSTVANLANGTNLLPSLTFSSDTNTGIYREGADALGFTAGGGTNQMVLTSTGLGIGTASPTAKLQVAWSLDQLKFTNPSAGFKQIGSSYTGYVSGNDYSAIILGTDGSAGGKIQFSTMPSGGALTTAATIDQYGNLGLGVTPSTISAGRNLEVGFAGSGIYSYSQTDTEFLSNAYYNVGYKFGGTGRAMMYAMGTAGSGIHSWHTSTVSGSANGDVVFTQAMTLLANGNLGIGETNPAAKLQVAGGNIRLDNNQGIEWGGGTNFIYGNNSTNILVFTTNNTERARITSVGGFETRPAATGHAVFNEDGVDADFRVESDTNTHMLFVDASTDRVGIGTNNPLNLFQLGTFGAIDGNSLQCYLRNNVYYDPIDARDESIKAGYSNVIVLDNNSGGILFQTTSTSAAGANVALSLVERARITSGGDLLVGTQTSGGKLTVEQGNANANGAFITNQTYNYQTLGLHNTATANDNILVAFGTEASYTTRGSIQYNRGAGLIAYLTTSDYRAKDISGPVVDSGALIDSVPVYMGKMKGATQERPMFIAHETPAYAHTGVKDAVDADGKPVYQQMDASALVPVMWAEIQSLRARVAQLEQGA